MRIAISGTGIAGPTLAYWLLRGGHEPTLIEKSPRLRSGGYWSISGATATRWPNGWGILPAILDAGYSVGEVRFVDKHGGKAAGFSPMCSGE